MELTVAYLREQFNVFNKLYFNSELPEPRLVVSNSRSRLGQFETSASLFKRRTFCIRVSDYFDVEEREYQNVLLHEMIHYYIAFKKIRDTSSHGREFRRMMHWLNEEHGWHISVSTRTKDWPVADRNKKVKTRYVMALQTVDFRYFLSVVHHDYVRYVDKLAKQSVFVQSHEWFVSQDEYFADFPQTRSLRGRRVDKDVYDGILEKLKSRGKA